jgi:hypothetical protein
MTWGVPGLAPAEGRRRGGADRIMARSRGKRNDVRRFMGRFERKRNRNGKGRG